MALSLALLVALGPLLGIAGCGRGGDLGQCRSLGPGREQEDCRLAVLRELPAHELPTALQQVPDADSRDLLRVRLVVLDPARFGSLCADVRHAGSRDWCRDALSRPHLGLGGAP